MRKNKQLKLFFSRGIVTIDMDDIHLLSEVTTYSIVKDRNNFYLQCVIINDKNRKTTKRIHQIIMEKHYGPRDNGLHIDHIDQNGLNNSKTNLRYVTNSLNILNSRKRKNVSSIYKGVTYHKKANKWQTYFRNKYVGIYKSEEDANKAYILELEKYYKSMEIEL